MVYFFIICVEKTIIGNSLEKVTCLCFTVNRHKITSADALETSMNFVRTANNVYEYLKTFKNKDTISRKNQMDFQVYT